MWSDWLSSLRIPVALWLGRTSFPSETIRVLEFIVSSWQVLVLARVDEAKSTTSGSLLGRARTKA